MTDDEFKAAVLARLDAIDQRLDAPTNWQNRASAELRAIVIRLDDQETNAHALARKFDRLTMVATTAIQESESLVSAMVKLRTRVAKLEGGEGCP